jgi:hypothetical protein
MYAELEKLPEFKISVKTGMYIKREMMVMEPVLASIALRKLLQEC